MAKKMTQEEWRAFVSHSTRTGKLCTVREDGSPHVAPVWFVLDGDSFVFNTGQDTVKGRNLARDGRVALCVDDDRPPFSYVVLQGRAEISEYADDAAAMLTWRPGSPPATWARNGRRPSAAATPSPANCWSGSRSTG